MMQPTMEDLAAMYGMSEEEKQRYMAMKMREDPQQQQGGGPSPTMAMSFIPESGGGAAAAEGVSVDTAGGLGAGGAATLAGGMYALNEMGNALDVGLGNQLDAYQGLLPDDMEINSKNVRDALKFWEWF